jgi:hypothetical protein
LQPERYESSAPPMIRPSLYARPYLSSEAVSPLPVAALQMRWDFKVSGFSGAHHPTSIPFGTLLLTTTHIGESSAYAEIEAWRSRMGRGEIDHVELIDLRPGGNLTDLHVDKHTEIPWSWKRK